MRNGSRVCFKRSVVRPGVLVALLAVLPACACAGPIAAAVPMAPSICAAVWMRFLRFQIDPLIALAPLYLGRDIAAEIDRDSHLAEHRRLDGQGMRRARIIRRVSDLNVIGAMLRHELVAAD